VESNYSSDLSFTQKARPVRPCASGPACSPKEHCNLFLPSSACGRCLILGGLRTPARTTSLRPGQRRSATRGAACSACVAGGGPIVTCPQGRISYNRDGPAPLIPGRQSAREASPGTPWLAVSTMCFNPGLPPVFFARIVAPLCDVQGDFIRPLRVWGGVNLW
jgi:hypothetical protein